MPDTPVEGIQDGDGGAFFGTYKTREEAEAGEKARSDKISQDGQRMKELEARAAAAENQAELLKALTEKVNATPAEQKADPQAEVDAMVKKIAKAYEDGDYETAARLQLQVNAGWVGQSEEQLERKMQERADALGITVKTLEKRLADQDPLMVAYGDAAKQYAEQAGVELSAENRDIFLNIAKANAKTDGPERHDLPGGLTSTRVVGREDRDAMSDEDWLAIGAGKMPTDKEKAALRKQWSKT